MPPDRLSFGPQQHAIDTVAQAVQGEKVHFLNARSLRMGYADMHVFRSEQISDLAPAATGKGDQIGRASCRERV